MATLLDGVNEVLKKAQIIQGDTGALSSLSDSAKQVYIDLAVQLWNEAIDELYSFGGVPKPNKLAENTITLATNDRDYALQSDLIKLHWPLIDETNGRFITEHPGGYMAIVNFQLQPANFTGLALTAAIRPTDGELYLDYIPTANENGLVYKYRYEKDLLMDEAADVMPFNNEVYRAMVNVVAQLWKRDKNNDFDALQFRSSLGRAWRQLSQTRLRESYQRQQVGCDTDFQVY